MVKFINKPNLPVNDLRHFIIGSSFTDEINELRQVGALPITFSGSSNLDKEIRDHADINFFYCGNAEIILNPESIGESGIYPKGIITDCLKSAPFSPYPSDIPLNCLLLDNKLVCNLKYTSPEIIGFAEKNSFEIINTKQGYARCTVCVVNENAVITEDSGLARLLKKYQIDVLKVSPNEVFLSEAHYGFLGGCSGKISDKRIYFSGNIEKHKDYKEIQAFLDNFGIEPIFNDSRCLRDFGGIIQLTESDNSLI